ncbi:VPLPA-CTERM sorting domain-containing protein [Roseobacter sp. A03A-229]
MKHLIASAIFSAALVTASTPLAAKTISFTGELDLYNYGGPEEPFGGVPGSIDVFIEVDETAEPDSIEDGGLAQLANYFTAVQSLTYEVFDGAGDQLGSWSAFDVQIQMLDFGGGDGIQFFSTDISGPEPLNRMQLLFEGAPGVWSNMTLDEVTQDALQNMTNAWMDINILVGEGAFGARFAIDSDSIEVAEQNDPIPSPVPLPAGLPLLLAGLGAFGWVRRGRVARTSDKALQA